MSSGATSPGASDTGVRRGWLRGLVDRLRTAASAAPRMANATDGAESISDVAFLRRLDRLALATSRYLRGHSEAVGQRPSWRRLPSNDFREHRLYLPGDDLRHVDWNASARSEHAFVKLGERPKEAAIHLLLDSSASMQWGVPSKLWASRRLAAALGYLSLNHGDRLIGADLSGLALPFGPKLGKAHVPALLRYLRRLPVAGPADVQGAARRHAARHQRGGLAIVISDLLGVPDLTAVLANFPAPRWQVLVIHLLHAEELEPRVRGEIELQDAETGERANFAFDNRAYQRYVANARDWCRAHELACEQQRATYARVLADWPIERAVMPYLRRRRAVIVP